MSGWRSLGLISRESHSVEETVAVCRRWVDSSGSRRVIGQCPEVASQCLSFASRGFPADLRVNQWSMHIDETGIIDVLGRGGRHSDIQSRSSW